jgi:hypothetical protein
VNAPSASADGFSGKLCGNPLAWRVTDSSCRDREVCPYQYDLSRSDIAIFDTAAIAAAVYPFGERLASDRDPPPLRLSQSGRRGSRQGLNHPVEERSDASVGFGVILRL